jgi:hypothetical protein
LEAAILFFGEFLVSLGLVTRDDLDGAVALQATHNRRLGDLAVEIGLLSAEQARKIRSGQQLDERLFGELAVALGFLDNEQVDQLRARQEQGHLRLGEALVEAGALTVDELADSLREYAVYQQQAARNLERAIGETAHPAVLTALVGAARLVLPRCGFAGCKVVEVRVVPHAVPGIEWSSFIGLSGELKIAFGLGLSSAALQVLATGMGHPPVPGDLQRASTWLGECVRFITDRAQTEIGMDLELGQVEVAPGDGFRWTEALIAERDFTQVELSLALPAGPVSLAVLSVATLRG